MTSTMQGCLSEEEAVAVLDTRIADAPPPHLASCTDCRLLVLELARQRSSVFHSESSENSQARHDNTSHSDNDNRAGVIDSSIDPSTGPDNQRYIIMERLGTGGMGVVYGAYDKHLNRKVALKVMRNDARTGRDHDGLRQEAQTLAQLCHPNVAAVHDVGSWNGRLFVSMEYVAGEDLRTWLRTPGDVAQDWKSVLGVYMQAGRGLAESHAHGIVHRDFKPDNVLVGSDGRARVVDFGLAAVMSHPQAPHDEAYDSATNSDAFAGTPAYMSPEQFAGKPAEPRSDQFSFCVALYESLYGSRPFPGDTASTIATAVQDGPTPPRGSKVPKRIWHCLQRGLATQPNERFDSMTELLSALERDPGKKARRIVTGGVIAVATIASLAYGITRDDTVSCDDSGATVASAWNHTVRDRVQAALSGAPGGNAKQTAALVTRKANGYADQLITSYRKVCRRTHASGEQSTRLLDVRTRCLDNRAKDLTALLETLVTLPPDAIIDRAGRAVESLSRPRACEDIESTDAYRPELTGEAGIQLAQARDRLGRAWALHHVGHYKEAVEVLEPIREAAQRTPSWLSGDILYALGVAYRRSGKTDQAETTLERAFEVAGITKNQELLAKVLLEQIVLLSGEKAKLADASAAIRLAPSVVELADSDELRFRLAQTMTTVLIDRGKFDKATEHARKALVIAERPPARALDIANARHGLGNALQGLGKFGEALVEFQHAARIVTEELGDNHPARGALAHSIAVLSMRTGKYAEAELAALRSLEIAETRLGKKHPKVADALNTLAGIYSNQARFDRVVQYAERAIAIKVQALGDKHPQVATYRANLAQVLIETGAPERAAAIAKRALHAHIAALGREHPSVALSHGALGKALARIDRRPEAEQHLRRAIAIRSKVLGPTHPRTLVARTVFAQELIRFGDSREAAREFDKLLPLAQATFGNDHPYIADILHGYGVSLLDQGRTTRATPLLERAVASRKKLNRSASYVGESQFALARALDRAGKKSLAYKMATKAAKRLDAGGDTYKTLRAQAKQWLQTHPHHVRNSAR